MNYRSDTVHSVIAEVWQRTREYRDAAENKKEHCEAIPDTDEADTDKAIWLLDVDGTINARRPAWPSRINRRHVQTPAGEYALTWSPALTDTITRLAQTGSIDIIWATSWCPEAHRLETLFGLPPLALGWDGHIQDDTALAAKQALFDLAVKTGRAVVWTDDEIPGLKTGGTMTVETTLLIRPDPKRGLTPDHLDAITAHCAQKHSGRTH